MLLLLQSSAAAKNRACLELVLRNWKRSSTGHIQTQPESYQTSLQTDLVLLDLTHAALWGPRQVISIVYDVEFFHLPKKSSFFEENFSIMKLEKVNSVMVMPWFY